MELKEEFTFQYNKQDINVKLCGQIYCAIFGEIAKPLKIEFAKDGKHKGKISTREGKFLSFIPSHALKGNEQNRISNNDLIKKNNLPLFCEICLNDNKQVLEVHHIKEHAIKKDDSKDNLRVYCSSCHSIVHNIRTIKRRAVRRFNPDMTAKEYDKILNK